jgi:hypothetical protein
LQQLGRYFVLAFIHQGAALVKQTEAFLFVAVRYFYPLIGEVKKEQVIEQLFAQARF